MYTEIDNDELIHKELKKYSKSIYMPLKLFKGRVFSERLVNCYTINPMLSTRPSKTKSELGNSYNLLFNNLKNWDSFPKREKSLIGTSSFSTAKSYTSLSGEKGAIDGKLYHVFPEYNSIIAIAPESDIWISFKCGLHKLGLSGDKKNLKIFNKSLNEIFSLIDGYENFDKNWDSFIKSVIDLTNQKITPKNDTLSLEAEIILKSFIKNKGNIKYFLEEIFDFNENDFTTEVYNEHLGNKFYDNEIWTEGCCLLIEHEYFKTLKL